jgi:hypothetical protein
MCQYCDGSGFRVVGIHMQGSIPIAEEAQALLRLMVRLDRCQKHNLIKVIDHYFDQQLTLSQVSLGAVVQAA